MVARVSANDQASVLFANEAFYLAFAGRDIAAMEELWSRNAAVTCTHPGRSPIIGRENVMRSWRAILFNPDSPAISCRNASAHILGDVGYILCHEQIDDTFLAATNVFIREHDGWKMVHHHAGPSPAPSFDPTSSRQSLQ